MKEKDETELYSDECCKRIQSEFKLQGIDVCIGCHRGIIHRGLSMKIIIQVKTIPVWTIPNLISRIAPMDRVKVNAIVSSGVNVELST
jgi:uncharacterized UBP type Zn finger protein